MIAVIHSGHLATPPELVMLTTILPDRTMVIPAVIHSGHLATPPQLAMLTTILPDRTTVIPAVIHSGQQLAMLTNILRTMVVTAVIHWTSCYSSGTSDVNNYLT